MGLGILYFRTQLMYSFYINELLPITICNYLIDVLFLY